MIVALTMSFVVGNALIAIAYFAFPNALQATTGYIVYLLLGLLPTLIALTTVTMAPRRRDGWRGLLAGTAGVIIATLAATQTGNGYMFEQTYAEDEAYGDNRWTYQDPEVTYPAQEQLLADRASQLASQRPNDVDLYAVLGAGTPNQQIFQREIEEMQRLLSERFGIQNKTLMLGATTQEPLARPLLNRTNLAASLNVISEVMDPAEDIALVFLTSHGSPEQISTYFSGLSSQNLTSADVARALTESGIQNLIIIVSACYSGSFIDDLEAPSRLILTSSAADRTSFGCSDDNIFTDWGSAFFNEMQRDTQGFIGAATASQATVSEQEKEAGLEPSLPQISEGVDIGTVLDRLNSAVSVAN